MSQKYKILVKSAEKSAAQEIDVISGQAQPVRIQAKEGVRYVLQDTAKQPVAAPDVVRASRKGNNLHLSFEGTAGSDVIIEDYYSTFPSDYNAVTGLAEDGQVYEYVPQDPTQQGLLAELTESSESVELVLSAEGVQTGAALAAVAPLIGPGTLAAGAGAGAAVAAGGGGGGGGSPTPTPTPVNTPPVAENATNNATEGAPVINGHVTAADVDANTTLTYSAVGSVPAGLTLNADGTYSFDASNAAYNHLAAGATQTVVLSYKANDGSADSNTATLTITVTGTNDAPVATASAASATKGAALLSGSVSATDADDGAVLTYSAVGSVPAGLTFNANGTYSFDPANAAYSALKAGQTQNVVLSFKANDGIADSNTQTLTITVTGSGGANTAPVAQAATNSATEGGATVTGRVTATDAENNPLTYSAVGAVPAGLTFNADGTYSFDPTNSAYTALTTGQTQDVVLSFKANDGSLDSNTSTLTISVAGVGAAPTPTPTPAPTPTPTPTPTPVDPVATALADIGSFAQVNATGLVNATGTVPDFAKYTTASITGLGTSTAPDTVLIAAVNDALASAPVGASQTATAAQIQAIVNAYKAVLAAAQDDSSASSDALSTNTFTLIGVQNVDSANLPLIRSLLGTASINPDAVNTVAELQALAAAVNKVNTLANGEPNNLSLTVDDMVALGLSDKISGTGDLKLFSDIIDQAASTAVDSGAKLTELADIADRLMQTEAGQAPNLTADELKRIGLSEVQPNLLADYIAAFKTAATNTSGANSTDPDPSTLTGLRMLVDIVNGNIPAAVTIAEAADAKISAAELSDGIQTTVQLPGHARVGDVVKLTVLNNDNGSQSTPLEYTLTDTDVARGSANITLPQSVVSSGGAVVDGNYRVTSQVTHAGVTTQPSYAFFLLDTTLPGLGVNTIAGDTVDASTGQLTGELDAAERGTSPAEMATPLVLTGRTDAEVGQTVYVTINHHTYTTQVQASFKAMLKKSPLHLQVE